MFRLGGICVKSNEEKKKQMDWADLEDETIVEYVHEGDVQALDYLINKYRSFVRAKARTYFLIGADREDIVQEGMIGLYKAIRDFQADKLSSFKAFAELCVTRQIITAIKQLLDKNIFHLTLMFRWTSQSMMKNQIELFWM